MVTDTKPQVRWGGFDSLGARKVDPWPSSRISPRYFPHRQAPDLRKCISVGVAPSKQTDASSKHPEGGWFRD